MRTITNLTLAFALALASVAPAASQTFEVLANFKPDLGMPEANLLHASDGYLYGTTLAGGEYGLGSVFRMRPNGTGFETVHSFSRSDGAYPAGELIEFAGALYGMTQEAGLTNLLYGAIYRIELANPSQLEVLHTFNADSMNGGFPAGGLLEVNGTLYGLTQGGGAHGQGIVFGFEPTANSFFILHSFDNSAGKRPRGTLVEVNGLLYGTTERGGQNNAGTPSQHDEGTLFRIDLLGLLFEHLRDLNGHPPAGLLKVGTDLYGTTSGYGSIFKFDTTRDQFEFVENVERYGALYPAAALMRASNGLIYGTTEAGGANGNGTIFELNVTTDPPSLIIKHSFVRDVTGRRPVAGLVDVGGLLYGTASERGPGFNGTIFSFDPGSGTTTVLHAFGPTGPYQPTGGPIEVGPSSSALPRPVARSVAGPYTSGTQRRGA